MVGVQVPKSRPAIEEATNPSKVPVTSSSTAPAPATPVEAPASFPAFPLLAAAVSVAEATAEADYKVSTYVQ